jgi:glucose-6-phosphate isomerase
MAYTLDPALQSLPVDSNLLTISRRIATKDASIWIEGSEAPTRLGWVDLAERSRALLPVLDALEARMRDAGVERVILSGMGGSSLAPEVIARTYKNEASRELILLDSTEPNFVDSVVTDRLEKTFFVISSKSGTTIETTSHLALIKARLLEAGLELGDHILVISDPDSPLLTFARENGLSHLAGDPYVGGRFSALSVFGLAPAALIGIDPSQLLDDASEMMDSIHENAVRLATYLAPHRYAYFADSESSLPGLADWIEQLIAESTGKHGKGILPIAISDINDRLDLLTVDLAKVIDAPLGAHFILWEWVTALLGYIYEVDPFDQPDVQATKTRTLEALADSSTITSSHSNISTSELKSQLETTLADREYIAICAFLDPLRYPKIGSIRHALEKLFKKPVTFGWGPRFLHSTGQFHKGGPKSGVFLSITMSCDVDVAIPGKDYGFDRLLRAQATGDRLALLESGNPVISVHLRNSRELQELISNFN